MNRTSSLRHRLPSTSGIRTNAVGRVAGTGRGSGGGGRGRIVTSYEQPSTHSTGGRRPARYVTTLWPSVSKTIRWRVSVVGVMTT